MPQGGQMTNFTANDDLKMYRLGQRKNPFGAVVFYKQASFSAKNNRFRLYPALSYYLKV
jgi:hypothetical protein